jgi:Tetratricopeptide repeat
VTAARDLYAALLPVRERVSGLQHPDTLAARGELATWTGWAGDAAAARDQYADLLPIRERVSGAEHLDTLATRGNLAAWTGAAGDAAAARDQYAALLPIVERVSGAEHPDTLAADANLAYYTEVGGMRPQPATGTPRCCLSASGCPATGTRPPWPPATASPTGPMRPYPAWTATSRRGRFSRVSGAQHPDTLASRGGVAHRTSKAEGRAEPGVD